MGRLFTDGAEFGDVLFWTLPSSVSASNVRKRTGNYSYLAGGEAIKVLPTLTEIFMRFSWEWSVGTYNSSGYFFAFYQGATTVAQVRINTVTRQWEYYLGTTLTLTGTIPATEDQLFVIDLHLKTDNSVGVFQMKIDGVMNIDYSGDTLPGATTAIDAFGYRAPSATGLYIYMDDIAINDTTGIVDNSWCGDGRVVLQRVNGNGDNIDFVPSAGDNWENVDEIPIDGDTTYNQGLVSGEYDLYNLEPCGLSNVSILRGWIEARARKTKASPETVLLGLKTDGTEYWNDSHNLMMSHSNIRRDHTINPKTGSAWTIADLDALQVGFKVE